MVRSLLAGGFVGKRGLLLADRVEDITLVTVLSCASFGVTS
jgi:hypothetical protein